MQTQLPTTIRERMKRMSMPVVYEEACRALVACTTIDEAKYFSDKADALAAWAKIYKSEEASVAAKRLKLYAYRRMGTLAGELRPTGWQTKKSHSWSVADNLPKVRGPGPISLLRESGFSKGESARMRRIARLPQSVFETHVNSPKVPTVSGLATTYLDATGSWQTWLKSPGPSQFRSFCRRHSARDLATTMRVDEAEKARLFIIEMQEWLDEFEQCLPKNIPQ